MKLEKKEIKKEKWIKPQIKALSFKDTAEGWGGTKAESSTYALGS